MAYSRSTYFWTIFIYNTCYFELPIKRYDFHEICTYSAISEKQGKGKQSYTGQQLAAGADLWARMELTGT
jgi:hypothetical protein